MTLTSENKRTLSAICARLVPSDELGPGAVQAGVPEYIEEALATASARDAPLYERGFALLDADAELHHGARFAVLEESVQDELLRAFESREPESEARQFFELVRSHTIEGMFGQPWWGGNREQIGWKLIGYPEPRLSWSEADQEIVALPSPRATPRTGNGR